MATEDDYGGIGHGVPDQPWGPEVYAAPDGFARTSDGLWLCCRCDERVLNRGEHDCPEGDYIGD